MRRLGFLCSFIVTIWLGDLMQLRAQNLVLNPSFESYTSCPFGISDLNLAVNWIQPYLNLTTDTCSTSDLFNTCSFEVPANLLGNEPARTGNGYAGIILYDGFPFLITTCDHLPTGWREYLEGTFSSPLVAGQTYCVSFYVSLADNVKFATDDLAVYFSNSQILIDCSTVGAQTNLPFTPQLQYTGPTLTNTLGWTKLQWSYVATGGEQYIIIGNFKDDSNTSYQCVNATSINSHAYYYVDDVEVIQTNVCCPIIAINETSRDNVSCFGASDGTVTVDAVNGAAPYSYSWSTGTTGATLSNRPIGSYGVTATDANGCSAIATIVITQPVVLTVTVLPSSTSCGTSATASPSGGTGPFSYSWSNGATVATISNLATGTYSVTVRDDNNCSATGSINATQSGGFTINSTPTPPTCGACDGAIVVTPVGGIPPYSYSWSSGQTSSTISSLCAGTYIVTVTEDSSGGGTNVFWSDDFTNGGTGWTLNISGPGINDANANQWIINNSSGCSSCPSTGSGGNYLHMTCGSGIPCIGNEGDCTYDTGIPIFSNATTDKYVTSPNIPTIGKTGITLTFWYMSEGESGTDYGLVRLSNNGGSSWTDLPTQYSGTPNCTQASISIPALYENISDFRIAFRWVNDNNFNGNDPPFMIDDIELSAATGSTACTATATVSINSANSPIVTLDSKADVKCFGDADGAININVSGGISPYTFLWTNGDITQNISGLDGGSYTVVVTDSASCAGGLSVNITEPASALSVSGVATDAGCGTPNGSINLTAGGGTVPYGYSWSSGSVSEDLTNIPAGDYFVTVTDGNLCTETDSFTVNAPGSFSLTLTADSALCAGADNGSVTSNVSGGSPPFQYDWSTGATTDSIIDLSAGVYTVTITDNNNCSVTDSATVAAPRVITAIASITKVQCEGGNDGGIKLIPFGGTPFPGNPPYDATWSNGQTGLDLTALPPGIYSATVTDANGCIMDTSFNLTLSSVYEVSLDVTDASCDGGLNGSVQANILSPTTPPYSYLWSTGDTLDSIANIAPGEYYITVTDILDCVRLDTATVGTGSGFEITDSVIDASCPGIADGSVFVTVNGGTEPYVYIWSNSASTSFITNVRAGEYFLTVTDAGNCSDIDSAIVGIDSSGLQECDSLIIYDVFSPNGDATNEQWVVDGLDDYTDNDLQIFNRWGNLVFEANPYLNDWDGKSKKGELLPAATYYYILKLNDTFGKTYSGTVTLIR